MSHCQLQSRWKKEKEKHLLLFVPCVSHFKSWCSVPAFDRQVKAAEFDASASPSPRNCLRGRCMIIDAKCTAQASLSTGQKMQRTGQINAGLSVTEVKRLLIGRIRMHEIDVMTKIRILRSMSKKSLPSIAPLTTHSSHSCSCL